MRKIPVVVKTMTKLGRQNVLNFWTGVKLDEGINGRNEGREGRMGDESRDGLKKLRKMNKLDDWKNG